MLSPDRLRASMLIFRIDQGCSLHIYPDKRNSNVRRICGLLWLRSADSVHVVLQYSSARTHQCQRPSKYQNDTECGCILEICRVTGNKTSF